MSKVIDRALAIILLVILASLAAHVLSLVVSGVLASGLDPVATALQRVLARGNP
jgi:predicted PurR-regulated permease PerM